LGILAVSLFSRNQAKDAFMLPMYTAERREENVAETAVLDLPESPSPFVKTGNKFTFVSLGCPRNLVDSEVMLGILLRAGYDMVGEFEDADYIVINTCGFLEESRQESLDTIAEAIEEKKPTAKVIVTGCRVQKHSSLVKSEFPAIDYMLGSGDVEGILKAVRAAEQGSEISTAQSYLEAGEVPRQLSTPQHYAYIKIAEGCRKRCAYCIIPDIKGPLKSKTLERVRLEFRTLLKQGVKEVILIAQDLGDWGKDMGFKRSEGLVHLLTELLKEEGDFWLRLMYLYPDEISDALLQLMKSDPRLCPYLDMPLQHINDTVLKSMHRATNRVQICDILTKLRNDLPESFIRTSLIVGYPGETEAQFEELLQFIQDYPLDNVGIFQYSQEEGSRAASLSGQIPEAVKQERYERLMTVQQEVVEGRLEAMIGRHLAVIVEGYHPESEFLLIGRHRGQAPEIDGQVILNDAAAVEEFGRCYEVEITDVAGYDLIGRAIQECPLGYTDLAAHTDGRSRNTGPC
jgi:ribosomal protein S12 methylthiotransferase